MSGDFDTLTDLRDILRRQLEALVAGDVDTYLELDVEQQHHFARTPTYLLPEHKALATEIVGLTAAVAAHVQEQMAEIAKTFPAAPTRSGYEPAVSPVGGFVSFG
jgi:hypothetical protein